ncbi:MAG: hypothetical protein RMK29_21730 [Myxococcales bacterium]|nr:hypothetical protein [Myxococcota bacterium]MDW8284334.1 hypothetical protein [Myxococcales bacterium]
MSAAMGGSIDAFYEGMTEKKILHMLMQRGLLAKVNLCDGKETGKTEVNRRLRDVVGPNVGTKQVRCLVLRDLDERETMERIKQGLQTALQALYRERGHPKAVVRFVRHRAHGNVYLHTCTELDVRVALHIATYRHLPDFCKSTIDDYVLRVALHHETAAALIKRQGWSISSKRIIHKVTSEIPALLKQNGIPMMGEAKDFIHFYAALLRVHTSPAVFAEKILHHAPESELREVFAPLRAAAEFLQDASSPSMPGDRLPA